MSAASDLQSLPGGIIFGQESAPDLFGVHSPHQAHVFNNLCSTSMRTLHNMGCTGVQDEEKDSHGAAQVAAPSLDSCIRVIDLTQDEVEFKTVIEDEEYTVVLPSRAVKGGV